MKRLTIRADEVRVGDRLADPDRAVVTDTERVTGFPGFVRGPGSRAELVEVWTEDDFAGMPSLTLSAHVGVEVWR